MLGKANHCHDAWIKCFGSLASDYRRKLFVIRYRGSPRSGKDASGWALVLNWARDTSSWENLPFQVDALGRLGCPSSCGKTTAWARHGTRPDMGSPMSWEGSTSGDGRWETVGITPMVGIFRPPDQLLAGSHLGKGSLLPHAEKVVFKVFLSMAQKACELQQSSGFRITPAGKRTGTWLKQTGMIHPCRSGKDFSLISSCVYPRSPCFGKTVMDPFHLPRRHGIQNFISFRIFVHQKHKACFIKNIAVTTPL